MRLLLSRLVVLGFRLFPLELKDASVGVVGDLGEEQEVVAPEA